MCEMQITRSRVPDHIMHRIHPRARAETYKTHELCEKEDHRDETRDITGIITSETTETKNKILIFPPFVMTMTEPIA